MHLLPAKKKLLVLVSQCKEIGDLHGIGASSISSAHDPRAVHCQYAHSMQGDGICMWGRLMNSAPRRYPFLNSHQPLLVFVESLLDSKQDV
jgi:hypothetical protein